MVLLTPSHPPRQYHIIVTSVTLYCDTDVLFFSFSSLTAISSETRSPEQPQDYCPRITWMVISARSLVAAGAPDPAPSAAGDMPPPPSSATDDPATAHGNRGKRPITLILGPWTIRDVISASAGTCCYPGVGVTHARYIPTVREA